MGCGGDADRDRPPETGEEEGGEPSACALGGEPAAVVPVTMGGDTELVPTSIGWSGLSRWDRCTRLPLYWGLGVKWARRSFDKPTKEGSTLFSSFTVPRLSRARGGVEGRSEEGTPEPLCDSIPT